MKTLVEVLEQLTNDQVKEIAEKGMEERGKLFKKTADAGTSQKIQLFGGWELIGIPSPKKGKVKEIYFISPTGHMEGFWDFMNISNFNCEKAYQNAIKKHDKTIKY